MGDEEEQKTLYFFDGAEEGVEHLTNPDGPLKVTYANGDSFEGVYAEGKKSGKGAYKWTGGAVYDGTWEAGAKTGECQWSYPDGGKYTGAVLNGRREGEGTYVYPNGDSYCGAWTAGAMNGSGIYTYGTDGSKLEGVWENGNPTSATWHFPKPSQSSLQGTFVTTEVKNDEGEPTGVSFPVPNGEATITFANGNTLNGKYVDGVLNDRVVSITA